MIRFPQNRRVKLDCHIIILQLSVMHLQSGETKVNTIKKKDSCCFKFVRKCQNALYGEYFLYSKGTLKYIAKEMASTSELISTREGHTIYEIYHKNKKLYLFPLFGQPLANIMNSYRTPQIARWVERCGSFENAMWEVLTLTLHLLQEHSMKEVILSGYRVYNGKVFYWYDSWIRSPEEVVLKDQFEMENHYFSPKELDLLRTKFFLDKSQACSSSVPFQQQCLIYKMFLLILHLGTYEYNLRFYEHGYFRINQLNLEERLKLFCNRYNSRGLGTLATKILSANQICLQEVESSLDRRRQLRLKRVSNSNSMLKASKLENRQHRGSEKIAPDRSFLSATKNHESMVSSAAKENNMSLWKANPKSDHKESTPINNKLPNNHVEHHSQMPSKVRIVKKNTKGQQTSKKVCSRKLLQQKFRQREKSVNTPALRYLDLDEHIPSNLFEQHLLDILEKVYVKDTWVKIEYENEAVYLGEMEEGDKHGKGIYLFTSGDVYYGDWVDNTMHGFGAYLFKSGELYQGTLAEGFKQGYGKSISIDGTKFDGYWSQNEKIGLGAVEFPNRVMFVGCFKIGSQKTQGLFIRYKNRTKKQWNGILEDYNWKNQEKKAVISFNLEDKRQQLKNCKAECFIKTSDLNGNVYEGEMLNKQKNGFGFLRSGEIVYGGHWKNNEQSGEGKLYIDKKFTIQGKWSQGVMVEFMEQPDGEVRAD